MSKIYNFFSTFNFIEEKLNYLKIQKKAVKTISMKETSDQGLKPSQNAWTGDTLDTSIYFKIKKFETFYKREV